MSNPTTWHECLIEAQGDGSALSASTTPTSILPAAAKITLPPGFFRRVGQRVRVLAHGRISTVVTTPGTMTFETKFGSTVVATTGALALNIVAKTNVAWELDWYMTCRAVGASANLMHQAKWFSEAVIGSPLPSAGGSGLLFGPASSPAVGTNFDSTASQVVDLFSTWSVNSGSNSITLHQFTFDSLN